MTEVDEPHIYFPECSTVHLNECLFSRSDSSRGGQVQHKQWGDYQLRDQIHPCHKERGVLCLPWPRSLYLTSGHQGKHFQFLILDILTKVGIICSGCTKKLYIFAKFDVYMVRKIHVIDFWVLTPCNDGVGAFWRIMLPQSSGWLHRFITQKTMTWMRNILCRMLIINFNNTLKL